MVEGALGYHYSTAGLSSLRPNISMAEKQIGNPKHVWDAADVIAMIDKRTALFGADNDLFGDPSWTMLLELYLARKRGTPFAVSDAAISARVSPTSGLRYLEVLRQRGLVRREFDAEDKRRSLVFITDRAADLISKWLSII